MGARQGHRQREDGLRGRVDMECRCSKSAVEWTWDAVAFGRRCWLGIERGRRQRAPPVDRVLRRIWEAPFVGTKQRWWQIGAASRGHHRLDCFAAFVGGWGRGAKGRH